MTASLPALFRVALFAMLAVLLALPPAAQALSRGQRNQLQQMQDNYAAAIRWGEFEQAWQLVDPDYRQAHPLSDLELQRYAQVQVSGYRDIGSSNDADGHVVRTIELRVINRHTMAERSLRYQERWRWDAEAKRWWIVDGLPDLWNGQ